MQRHDQTSATKAFPVTMWRASHNPSIKQAKASVLLLPHRHRSRAGCKHLMCLSLSIATAIQGFCTAIHSKGMAMILLLSHRHTPAAAPQAQKQSRRHMTAPYVPVSWLPLVQEQASPGSISNQVGVRQHSTWKKGRENEPSTVDSHMLNRQHRVVLGASHLMCLSPVCQSSYSATRPAASAIMLRCDKTAPAGSVMGVGGLSDQHLALGTPHASKPLA